MWEPVKLQLKLKLTKVRKLWWDKCLGALEQNAWKDTLAGFIEYNELRAYRCPLLKIKQSQSKVRLICLADATEQAGGAAIYAGMELT